MACAEFPTSGLVPNVTTHVVDNVTYRWDGTVWEAITSPFDSSQISHDSNGTVKDTLDRNSEYLALKIFQAPTDGGLTEIQTRTVDAGEVYEVRKTSDGSLATIYSNAAGTTEIVQNGTDNKSGSDGVVEFYIADGDYYVEVDGVKSNFTDIVKATNVETSDGKSVQDTHDAMRAMLIAQGLSGNFGFFEKGFDYVNVGDVGIDTDGKIYTYVGAAALPVTVVAGTNPVGDGDYNEVVFSADLVSDFIKSGLPNQDQLYGMRNVNLMGDSISQGFNATNKDKFSWSGIFRRILNNQFGENNLGFMGLSSSNTDYHTVTKTSGAWVDSAAGDRLGGIRYDSSDSGAILTIKLLKKQDTFSLCYDQVSGGGAVEIRTNGMLRNTLSTGGVEELNKKHSTISLSGYKYPVSIEVKKVDALPVTLSGLWYSNGSQGAAAIMPNNYARSGLKLTDLSDGVIDRTMAANMVVMAMGHNDDLGGSDQSTFTNKINRIITKANANDCYVVVYDFIWSKGGGNFYRSELKRLARSVEKSKYLALADDIYSNDINSMVADGFFESAADTSHPSNKGHNMLSTYLANSLGLSTSAPYLDDDSEKIEGDTPPWSFVGGSGQPAFQNSWVNVLSSPDKYKTKFRKANGLTHIDIYINGGDSGTVAFTLPDGYRPNFNQEFNLFIDGTGSTAIWRKAVVKEDGNVEVHYEGFFGSLTGSIVFPYS